MNKSNVAHLFSKQAHARESEHPAKEEPHTTGVPVRPGMMRLVHVLAIIVAVILVLVPFHAFLTVWGASVFGHYTLLRLWKEVLLVPLGLGAVYLVAKHPKLRHRIRTHKVTLAIASYLAVQVMWGLVAFWTHHVTAKALGYGWVVNTRFLLFFVLVWVVTTHAPKLQAKWEKLVFWPAAVVILFGLLQFFVLPYDFLRHFGYGAATIFPYQDINHNVNYIRVMSTLRGANPLGTYLIVILSLLLGVWMKKRNWWCTLLIAAGTLTLVLSFSRGAWVGFAGSVATILWLQLRGRQARQLALAGLAICVLIVGAAVFTLRHNVTFENIFFHTQQHSLVKTTSDEGHASALRSGLHDVLHEPLGRGPGTAGPASVYNTGHHARIAENYYIQIAQETGWIGLALFVAINLLVAQALWRRRAQPLALGLFAALVGVSIANCFSHAWADDTLAFLWWGLAGIALIPSESAGDK